ncbi:MAG: cation transporter [Anaerolineaceae bacterium]|nr:cation transporter [Anaerolineaceae bacterium]
MKEKTGQKTLLASVVLSAPGPIVLGIGLFFGRSSTQIADFIRRTAELVAIIVSWLTYKATAKDPMADPVKKEKLERTANLCVGWAMSLSGIAMLLISFLSNHSEKGNVVLSLVIAILGAITNSWFWLRYRKLNREEPNAIIAVQSKLYRAKALVDICVTTALAAIAIAPTSPAAAYLDIIGSVIVAVYLLVNGLLIVFKKSTPESKVGRA